MDQHPRLKTERLFLRKLALRDVEEIFTSYAQDQEFFSLFAMETSPKKTETRASVKRLLTNDHTGLSQNWIIKKSENADLAGMIALNFNGLKSRLGFVLARHHWGQGVATEAPRSVIDWTLRQPGYEQIEAFCDEENSASARVLEKSGMKRESLLRSFGLHPNFSINPRKCWHFVLRKPIATENR